MLCYAMLLEALREMVLRDGLGKRQYQQLEDTAVKLVVRVALLQQHRQITPADVREVFRRADSWLLDIIRKYDATRPPPHVDEQDPRHEQSARYVM